MKATLESTTKIVQLCVNGGSGKPQAWVDARIWEGVTANGIRFHAYITRVAVANDQDATEFYLEMLEQRAPSPEIEAIPLRLVL